jgi:hypothetical protein
MSVGTGHNSGEVKKEDLDVLWAIHTRDIVAEKAKIKAANQRIKEILSDAKNDKFERKEILDYVEVMTSDDQKKHVDKFNMMKRNRVRLGLITDHGNDLLSRDDRAARLQLIDADGYEAGLNGLDRVSRQTGGSDEDRAWLDAYQRGQNRYGQNWQRVMEEKQARRAAASAAADKESPPEPDEDD